MTCCDRRQTRITPAFHSRTLLGRDQPTIKKTSHPTALCCVAQCIMDIMVSVCFFYFSVKIKNNFLPNGKTTRMGWRRLEQRVFTFILHISFLFKLITIILVDFSAITCFFLFADTLATIKTWNTVLFKQKSRPEFGGSVQRWVPMPTFFFFPSSLCCVFDSMELKLTCQAVFALWNLS